jgi:hypothetical protein
MVLNVYVDGGIVDVDVDDDVESLAGEGEAGTSVLRFALFIGKICTNESEIPTI